MVDADKFIAARDALLAEVRRVQNEPVPAAELAKVVKQFIAGMLSTRKTMQGQAQDLGSNWLAANDLNFSERYLAAVKRVTPAVLQRVAREYLTAADRTLYALLPAGTAPEVRRGRSHVFSENRHPKNRLSQRPAPSGQGRSPAAVRRNPRRFPGRRAGRD